MKITKTNPILNLVNDFLIDSPAPNNISYFWNFGSQLGLNLVLMIVTGILLAMHYNSSVQLAFNSVEHICRDVNAGWQQRYLHANGASSFFFMVYLHIGRGLFYGSYRQPRGLQWIQGVQIFIAMMATAFIGYVLPWGLINLAPNEKLIACYMALGASKIPSSNRIGLLPHNIDLLSVLIGNLQGDVHGELRNHNPRFSQHMSKSHMEYLYWSRREDRKRRSKQAGGPYWTC